MCIKRKVVCLSRITVVLGLASLILFVAAFSSNVWIHTREIVLIPNSDKNTTIDFKIGLWRVCPKIDKKNIAQYIPSPACSLVQYSSAKEEITHSDIGIWTNVDFTTSFLTDMRMSTPFFAVTVILLFIIAMETIIGHFKENNKTLVAVIFSVLTDFSLGSGLIVFMVSTSNAIYQCPRRTSAAHALLYPSEDVCKYSYGWCFQAAAVALTLTEINAFTLITVYFGRFTSLNNWVLETIPGFVRKKIKREATSERVCQDDNSASIRENTAQNTSNETWVQFEETPQSTNSDNAISATTSCSLNMASPAFPSCDEANALQEELHCSMISYARGNQIYSFDNSPGKNKTNVLGARSKTKLEETPKSSCGVTIYPSASRCKTVALVHCPPAQRSGARSNVSSVSNPFSNTCNVPNSANVGYFNQVNITVLESGTPSSSSSGESIVESTNVSIPRKSVYDPRKGKHIQMSTFGKVNTNEERDEDGWSSSEV